MITKCLLPGSCISEKTWDYRWHCAKDTHKKMEIYWSRDKDESWQVPSIALFGHHVNGKEKEYAEGRDEWTIYMRSWKKWVWIWLWVQVLAVFDIYLLYHITCSWSQWLLGSLEGSLGTYGSHGLIQKLCIEKLKNMQIGPLWLKWMEKITLCCGIPSPLSISLKESMGPDSQKLI